MIANTKKRLFIVKSVNIFDTIKNTNMCKAKDLKQTLLLIKGKTLN